MLIKYPVTKTMTNFDRSFGRGKRLESVMQQIPDKKPNDLQSQLHTACTSDYTNESIEKFCSQLTDKLSNGFNSGSHNTNQFDEEINLCLPEANSSQLEICDKSEIAEISNRSPCIDSGSEHSQVGSNVQKMKNSCIEAYNYSCEKDFYECTSRPMGGFSKYKPHNPSWKKPGKISSAIKSQIKLEPLSKGMGRGQRLQMVTMSIPRPQNTIQNEIEMACDTGYSNQCIEKFLEKLSVKNGYGSE